MRRGAAHQTQALLVLALVHVHVLVERVLVAREVGVRPLERREVELVDGLTLRAAQRAQQAAVEAALQCNASRVESSQGTHNSASHVSRTRTRTRLPRIFILYSVYIS